MTPFIKRAQVAQCATNSNRLYTIDKKYVLWDRAGDCPDNSMSMELYALASQAKVCSLASTIAGPKKECADQALAPMFDTIVARANDPGLGLGAAHVVEEVKFLPANGLSVDFKTIASDRFSGVATARNVVVRDQAAFDALWAEHSAIRIPAPAAPKVDFKTEMVIALFGGNDSACASFGVRRAVAVDDRLVVYYERKDPDPAMACIAVVANPMQMIVVPRVDAAVDFVKITTQDVPFTDVFSTPYAVNWTPRNVVIKDAATFATIWRDTGTSQIAPAVDFNKEMLVAVFGPHGANGCENTKIESIYRDGGKLQVSSVNWRQGPSSTEICPASLSKPVHLVKLARSDETVAFSTQTREK
ncbi:hypothetical protein EJB06_21000 [Massilia atriviolacea]|uniref:Uncharacterized protein n=2 Tax=Massilia atriviolacea TaxID=2495579 RepID=A0A430HI40_9BURK|nr:hypothetical protein EJB06_21000 [Massilia atriviolacea]